MRPTFLVVALVALSSSSLAQSGQKESGLGLPSASAATSWIQNQWAKVQREGKPVAERIVREAPEQFQKIKQTAPSLMKRIEIWSRQGTPEQRAQLLGELWRLRGSLDLMALLEPETLENLTGIDAKLLKELRAKATSAYATIQRSG